MNATPAPTVNVTVGNGRTVHLSQPRENGNTPTMCGAEGRYNLNYGRSRVRVVTADATCKNCARAMEALKRELAKPAATKYQTASITYTEGRASTLSREPLARQYVDYWNTGDVAALEELRRAFNITEKQTDADDTQAHHELITWDAV